MAISQSKVVIIGVGNVGTALAHQIVINNICDELILVDLNEKKAKAEATDLKHSLGYSEIRMDIRAGQYSDCSDADIVVLTVGTPYYVGMTRLDMLDKATDIVKSIVPNVMKSGFNGLFIVITNPVDAMSYLVYKLSGLPAKKVIGTGTSLDSARLRQYLAEKINVDPRSVEAISMGEHGDSQMIPWSQVTIGGKSITEIIKDNPDRLEGITSKKAREDITKVAYEIMMNKGSTNFGIAAVAMKIIKSIIRDAHVVLPVSVMLDHKYGADDVYAGVPAVITRAGIKELVHYNLQDSEYDEFNESIRILKEVNERMLQRLELNE